ncbi:MAG: RIP metalloprotease RseP [Bdellovibrionota bacterium]
MLSILGFLIILGPLVVVHEFGHYMFARIFRVKAEIFSIGFGPRLWSKQLGETELRVSAIPLGGYVKLLGEERDAEIPASEAKRALHRQAPWKRFFIFFGGPLFNFLFAILIFMAILVIGEPQYGSYATRVVHKSQAEKAGFLSGDKILKIDDLPVRRFEEVANIVGENPGRSLTFEVMHVGATQPVTLSATPTSSSGFSVYGEQKQVGEIEGLYPTARGTELGVSNLDTPAAKAGLMTGDKVLLMNGEPVSSYEEMERRYSILPHSSIVRFQVEHSKEAAAPGAAPVKETREASFVKPAAGESMAEAWGLHSAELFVSETVKGSPAETAGLKPGDRLIGVGDTDVQSFFELKDAVQHAGEAEGKVPLRWERSGKLMTVAIHPTATKGMDPVLNETTQFTVGVIPHLSFAEPEKVVERIWNPFKLVYKATERMISFSWRNLVSIRKMFGGDVSVKTLGGPIMIGKIAGESLAHGLITFLTTMAILSISLGVLNVLPVPVLDGGHLLLLAIETVRGKPLKMRTMEIIQGVGLVLILVLMGLVLKNDITRLTPHLF